MCTTPASRELRAGCVRTNIDHLRSVCKAAGTQKKTVKGLFSESSTINNRVATTALGALGGPGWGRSARSRCSRASSVRSRCYDKDRKSLQERILVGHPHQWAPAYCVLRTKNIFVCWCCVGSDRAAGVGVSLGVLDLVRVDGRPCLGVGVVTQPFPVYDCQSTDRSNFQHRLGPARYI